MHMFIYLFGSISDAIAIRLGIHSSIHAMETSPLPSIIC
jgi:hypothetical protein